jgi:restriction system protein
MGHSRGLISTLIRIERAARRAQAAQLRAVQRAQRQAERSRRAEERFRQAVTREEKRAYLESRIAEADEQNAELEKTIADLRAILAKGLKRDSFFDLDTLKEPLKDEPVQPGELAHPISGPRVDLPPPLGWVMRLIPGAKAKHQRQFDEARRRYDEQKIAHEHAEKQRQEKLEQLRLAHEEKVAENRRRIEAQHAQIEELKRAFQERSADAVTAYFSLVLDHSEYPEGFLCSSDLTYQPASKKLVIDFQLPGFDVVPEAASYKYVKSKNEISESARAARERRLLYGSVIAQAALRTLHEVFSADRTSVVDTVDLSGYVHGIDRGTGQPAKPCVLSVRASPDVFASLDLRRVDPLACLQALRAAISKSPADLVPVEAVHDFSAIDPRFLKHAKT